MSNSFAINGISDPYLAMALQSPNYNAMAFKSTQPQQQAYNVPQTPQYGPVVEPKKENNHTGLKVAGTVLAIGAAALCIAGAKKGNGEGVAKMVDGIKQIWNGFKGKAGEVLQGGKAKEQFQAFKTKSGEWVYSIPGSKQRVTAECAEALGISTEAVKLGEKGTELITTTFKHNGNTITTRGDKVIKCVDSVGKDLLSSQSKKAKAYQSQLETIIANIKKGMEVKDIDIQRIVYNHKADGVVRRFIVQDNVGHTALNKIITNRFTGSSNAVKALRFDNKIVDEAIKAIEGGKIPKELAVAQAISPIDKVHNLIFKDGVVSGITKNGKFYSVNDDVYKAFIFDHPNVNTDFTKLTKDKNLQDIIYKLAS